MRGGHGVRGGQWRAQPRRNGAGELSRPPTEAAREALPVQMDVLEAPSMGRKRIVALTWLGSRSWGVAQNLGVLGLGDAVGASLDLRNFLMCSRAPLTCLNVGSAVPGLLGRLLTFGGGSGCQGLRRSFSLSLVGLASSERSSSFVLHAGLRESQPWTPYSRGFGDSEAS